MDRQRQRMQAVLRDRFGLKLRLEKRELPIYVLKPAKGGSKLTPPGPDSKGPSMRMSDKGELSGAGANMRMLTNTLAQVLGRPVMDETGVEGTFDFELKWKPEAGAGQPPQPDAATAEAEGASLFTAISEQLGLRLEPKKGPVSVYIVVKAERPTEN